MEAIRLHQTVQKNGEIHLTNLPITAGQDIELLLLFTSRPNGKSRLTARQLLNSELIGLWKDRVDIADNVDYARQLRNEVQRPRYDNFGQ